MIKSKQPSPYNIIIIISFFTTIILTPMINKDSLIIPKLMLLFILACYLLPKLIYVLTDVLKFVKIKILLLIIFLIMIQTVLVTILSEAPLEQQIFGRTGRGLGVITLVSLLLVTLASAIFIKHDKIKLLFKGLVASCVITSVYSLFQSFGLDFLEWESRTNGIIGTLGNPNFQSSFAALTLIPSVVLLWGSRYKYYGSILIVVILLWVILETKSIQGVVSATLATLTYLLIYFWYRQKSISILFIVATLLSGFLAILGMLNRGPFSAYLYKVSVQSRGDFWRSALTTANEHPFFGVGIDSFGDSYLKYRDSIAVSHPWAEYTDNAHNFFLEYAATAGYPMVILQLSLIILTLFSYIHIQKKISHFDRDLTAIFVAWVTIQAQSFISPGNISVMLWNAVLSGTLIGYSVLTVYSLQELVSPKKPVVSITRGFSYISVFFAILITFPLFNVDRLQLKAMTTGDGDLAISSVKQYPESVLRYQVIARELFNANLQAQALDVARSAVEFNPKSASLWALVIINPAASLDERAKAKAELIKLDPLNKEVKNYEIK